MAKVVVFGADALASLLTRCLQYDSSHTVVAYTVNADYLVEESHEGLSLVAFEELESRFAPADVQVVVPLGWRDMNGLRRDRLDALHERGYSCISYISSRASTWPDLVVGEHCIVYELSAIQPYVTMGRNVVVRGGVQISHHCTIGSDVFIANGVTLGGSVQVGERCVIGLGAVVRDGVRIAPRTFVGAGAVVIEDTESDGVYVGSPARRLPDRSAMEVTG